MPTPVHRAGRRAARSLGVFVVSLLLVLAYIQAQRVNHTIHELRSFVGQQRAAQVSGCHRGNALRGQVNSNVSVLDGFLAEAVKARNASGDHKVAVQYQELRVKLRPLDLTDCEAAYPRPPG